MKDFLTILKNAQERDKDLQAQLVNEAIAKENLSKLLDPSFKGWRPSFQELMGAQDFSFLVQKVVTDRLQVPPEPEFIGLRLFSRTINLDPNTVFQYPVMGQVSASDVPMGRPIPAQDLDFTVRIMASSTKRSAIAFDVEKDLLNDAMYDLIPFFVDAGNRALNRHKEKKVWYAAVDEAHVVFDNENSDPNFWTTGKHTDGVTPNGSICYDDFLMLFAGLVANGYAPDAIIGHPLAWAVWHKDPLLRAQFYHMSSIAQNIFSKMPGISDSDTSALMPWGIRPYNSRFMPIDLNGTLTGGVALGSGTAMITDFLVIDSGNQVVIASTEAPSMDRWDVNELDTSRIVMKEKYEVYGIDYENSAVKAKNIRLVDNHKPLFNAGMVTL